ncbi:vancomycin high temperature exclusion protein [Nocardia sp. NPDC004068]|uniref:SanA/YdcF family protein n=1 Tax=Nocardia sp. NPDC004068 TaxID=3364303 RepID=UPI0036CDDC22
MWVRWIIAAGALSVLGAHAGLRMLSRGRRFTVATAPPAPTVIVPGAKVAPDGSPLPYLRGRLDAAIDLVRTAKADTILISGDATGESGNEIAAMHTYLLTHGIPPTTIQSDGEGLTTRATCQRARQLFDITEAIIVTQPQHLPRAIALARHAGIDAHGVAAPCDCRRKTLIRNTLREWLAAPKAILTMAYTSR